MQITYNSGSTHRGRDIGSIKVTYKDGAVHMPDSDGKPNKENGQQAAECLRTLALLKKPTGDNTTAAEKLIESDIISEDKKRELAEKCAASLFSKLDDPSASSGEKAEALIRLIDLWEYMTEEQAELVGRTFRHFKGNLYRLEGFAKDSETLEEMVVYRALYGEGGLWVRPAKMFFETVERDGRTMKRFEPVKDEQ